MDSAACIGVRRVRRRVQERLGGAVHVARRSRTSRCCPRDRSSATRRVVRMVDRHDAEGFGSCSNEGECEAVCPKEIPITNIARMNREYLKATLLRGD